MDINTIVSLLITTGVLGALAALIGSVFRFLKKYFDKKTETLEKTSKMEEVHNAIDKTEDAIWTIVMQLAQEYVDTMKENSSDNKLTDEQISFIRGTAYSRVLAIIGQPIYELLKKNFNDADAWVYAKIDAYAREIKPKKTV